MPLEEIEGIKVWVAWVVTAMGLVWKGSNMASEMRSDIDAAIQSNAETNGRIDKIEKGTHERFLRLTDSLNTMSADLKCSDRAAVKRGDEILNQLNQLLLREK